MTNADGIYVLYQDEPKRRYRRIAAKSQETSFIVSFSVEITEGEPFVDEGSDVQSFPFNTMSEAKARAQQECESSLLSGWRQYPDASL